MEHVIRSRKLRIGLGALLVATGLAAAGVELAPAAGARTHASAPPLDHFLCYIAASKFPEPPAVMLENQFAPNGFLAATSTVSLHCNPVAKTVSLPAGPVTTQITNPAAHLLCFKIKPNTAPVQTPFTVKVTNQFGTAVLVTKAPTLLCVPSWKSLTGPPNNPVSTPPGLDHFTCYPVAYVAGGGVFKPAGPVSLQDQFVAAPVPAKVATPKMLCLPTSKTVDPNPNDPGGGPTPITNPTMHLLCFGVSVPITAPAGVWDQNQFGTAQVTVRTPSQLCLPSTKVVLSGPGGVT